MTRAIRLKELNARLYQELSGYGALGFDCPRCRSHRIRIRYEGVGVIFGKSGNTVEDVCIEPSVNIVSPCDTKCLITNGEVTWE